LQSCFAFLDERTSEVIRGRTMIPVWIVSLILGLSVTEAKFTNAKLVLQQEKPVLTVLVLDSVDTDSQTLNIARAETIRILDKAGIDLRWINPQGSEGLHLPSETKSYVTVVIAGQPPSGWTSPDSMGFAPARTGPYRRAYVFTSLISPSLQSFGIRGKSAFGIILGHAIAHELGHLLIPGEAHGNGIMFPNWGYREWQQALQGTLLFAPLHAQALREALQSR
jgi:hypothetical protein